jgi:hypothetical protein
MNVATRLESADWHDLLDRACAAERERDALADAVLRDHDECHADSARWCRLPACRLAEARRR